MEAHPSPVSHYPAAGQPSKVAIPRLRPQEPEPPPTPTEKHRATKACTNCRKRKVKCTGGHPRCKNCEGNDTPCTYELARKDRLKTATEQNRVLISLLKDLVLRASEGDKKKIDATLDAVDGGSLTTPDRLPDSHKASGKRPRKESPPTEDVDATFLGEAHAPASVGSNGDLDLLDEDLLRSKESRETGFVGQNSEVQWLRSLQRQISATEEEPYGLPYGPPGSGSDATAKRIHALHERRRIYKSSNTKYVADSSFYLDSDSLEVDIMVDPYELPSPDLAEMLFKCYMETVHNWFPILPETYEDQFHRYINSIKRGQRFQVPEKWQAILNLVFAIGARFAELIEADWLGETQDHFIYMKRAVRILDVKGTALIISAPDLSIIQATGLLSFYYLTIGRVSRAWVMVGISLHFALAVGLHLRNEDPLATQSKKINCSMIWWSLHSVESLLSSITGRPCTVASEDCTVPLPEDLHEENTYNNRSLEKSGLPPGHLGTSAVSSSPASGISDSFGRSERYTLPILFLDNHMRIGITTRKVLKLLYSPRTSTISWERIQLHITTLLTELDQWATAALPPEPNSPRPSVDFRSDRERFLLSLHYYSIKILITRPCLCRLERRIKDQSDGSLNFNQKMAETCVQAAQNITSLFPNHPDPKLIYQKGPWWCVVHNLMQAMAVFLLEMLYQGTHMMSQKTEGIPLCIKKLLRLLKSMRHNNEVAKRAYKLAMSILQSWDPQLQSGISNILAEEETEIDRGKLFQDHVYATQSPDPTSEFPAGQWQPDLYDPGDYNLVSDPYFLPESHQMSGIYGNPFLTNFDQANPISLSMDDYWRNFGEEILPNHPQNGPQRQPPR